MGTLIINRQQLLENFIQPLWLYWEPVRGVYAPKLDLQARRGDSGVLWPGTAPHLYTPFYFLYHRIHPMKVLHINL